MPKGDPDQALSLVVRRTVRGTPEEVFRAWTDPTQLQKWWGPQSVECSDCTIDLRIGGAYRIGNRFADGSVIWISGEFLRIEPPHMIEFTWHRETGGADHGPLEKVCVRLTDRQGMTDVVVEHSRIRDQTVYRSHRDGWLGCLDGLARYLGEA